MGKKSGFSEREKLEAVLLLLRHEEPVAVLTRRYGVSDVTLYRWRDAFIEGGKAALRDGKGSSSEAYSGVGARASEARAGDRGKGIANRLLKKLSQEPSSRLG